MLLIGRGTDMRDGRLQIGRHMSLNEGDWEPQPKVSFDGLTVEEMANCAIFLFGQYVSFCNDDSLIQSAGKDERRHTHDHQAIALDACRPRGLETKATTMHVLLLCREAL